jgi:hypothetical protein
MRNTIIAVVAAGLPTFAVLTPAFATGVCSNYPNLDGCPIYEVYGDQTPPASSSSRATPRHIRHAQSHPGRYAYHG